MTPALTGLTYASFIVFERRADASVAHHATRLIAAFVLGVTLFLSAGSSDSVRSARAIAPASVDRVGG